MSEDDTNASLVLAGMIGEEIKSKVAEFRPDRLYLEVRPPIGRGSKDDWFNLRVPQGMKAYFVEHAKDPDNLDYAEREANMAGRLANYLRLHPGGRVALICGSCHSEGVASRLRQLMKGRPNRVSVEHVRIPFSD